MPPSKPLFKPYIGESISYMGGKSIGEIQTTADKIYKLSSNENPFGPSPKAIEAIKKSLSGLHFYPDRTDSAICARLADYYRNEIGSENFLAANSGSECLEYITRAFLDEGHECIISTPAFGLYKKLIKWTGAKSIDVPLIGPDFDLDVDGIISAINERTRLIFLTSPNNPSGTQKKKGRLENLLSKIPENVLVVYDEVYYLFCRAEDYSIALPYVKTGKNIIGVNSFSKSHGLAGLRLGYLYSTNEIVSYIKSICRPFLLNSLALEAGKAAILDEDFVNHTVKAVEAGREFLYNELQKLKIRFWESHTNFIMIKPELDSSMMEQELVKKGIMTREVSNFGAAGCLRITIGTEEANKHLMKALGELVAEHR